MTKKDYILIAKVEAESYDAPYSQNEIAHIDRLANALQEENPLFNSQKFIKACGVEDEWREEE